MQLTRQQRINNVSTEIVEEMRKQLGQYRRFLKDGIKLPEGTPPGYPAFVCTGQEIKDALGDNLKPVETVIEFVLDGKSNQIMKGVVKGKPKK